MDTNFDRFNLCILPTEIFSLVFTCRYIRKKYLPKLKIFFELADGFGSQQRWYKFLNQTYKNIFRLVLYSDVSEDCSLDFLFNKFSNAIRSTIFQNLNLPSILCHFLTCKRSCDTFPSKCFNCSLVGLPNDILLNPFLNYFDEIEICKNNCSFFNYSMYIDLDVFTSKANEYFSQFFRPIFLNHSYCRYYKEFHYSDQLFVAFCSHLIRFFLNTLFSIADNLSESISKQELKKVFIKSSTHFFSNFIHQFNIEYFYELFDIFEYFNKSVCYCVKKKSKFGPYIHSAFDITITMIHI